ncbi:hypothetical protein Tco_0308420 [Tanacetum coccineum]
MRGGWERACGMLLFLGSWIDCGFLLVVMEKDVSGVRCDGGVSENVRAGGDCFCMEWVGFGGLDGWMGLLGMGLRAG